MEVGLGEIHKSGGTDETNCLKEAASCSFRENAHQNKSVI